jgi:hypothetical protein
MKKILLSLLFFGVSLISLLAQSHEPDTEPSSDVPAEKEEVGGRKWGIKLGPTVGLNGSSNPLFRYHGAVFIEGGREKNALYAEIGYHARGFSNNYQLISQTTGQVSGYRFIPTIFHNVGLSLGMKKRNSSDGKIRKFYAFAMRGEVNVGSNLPDRNNPQQVQQSSNYGFFSNNIRPFVWGMDISGGFEKQVTNLVIGFLEFTVSPDLSLQYGLPIQSPSGGGTTSRNLSLELSLGFRFWNKVIYE